MCWTYHGSRRQTAKQGTILSKGEKEIMPDKPTLTTSAGAPVADNQNSMTAGPRGPVLLQDYQLIEKLAHQNRERIAERPVHAKGWEPMVPWKSPKISPGIRKPKFLR